MGETYSCTFANCDKVFLRSYELKKHTATHEDPNSVLHCPECDFITLKKRRLGIHFAIHTGEKNLECPDMIQPGAHELRCDYRTHDPAALSRHRKKAHGYIPPLNRSRPKVAPAIPPQTRQTKDEKITRRRRPSKRPAPASRRNPNRVPCMTKDPRSGPPTNTTLFLPREDVDGNAMEVGCYEDSGYDSSGATLVGSDDGMGLDILFDSSLRSQWMAKFEESYSTFDMTGPKHHLEPLPADLPFGLSSLDMHTGREGCLCPEWMVEAGADGWDQSVLDTHRQFYVFDA